MMFQLIYKIEQILNISKCNGRYLSLIGMDTNTTVEDRKLKITTERMLNDQPQPETKTSKINHFTIIMIVMVIC